MNAPSTPIIIPSTSKNKIPVAAFSLTPFIFFAPKCCATTTPFPAENPVATASIKNTKLAVVPTAESAASPVKFPTTIVSTVL